jgi:hypothetical protein
MGVLKRVCEETPTPIRQTHPEVPDWLAEIVERLQAKDPAARFQSAAEVAEVLGRHLAHVQHPSVVPLVAVTKPAGGSSVAARRGGSKRWAAAVAVVVATFAVLGTTEATGVTNVRATVVRVFTPDGVLVVETDDPSVKVTVEGDGGLVITGAGLEEIRLRPGSYRVVADRDGKHIPLDRELVTVSRRGREIVRVKVETAPSMPVVKAEAGAFVVLGGKGVPDRKFDTLAEAVLVAADGDTIEVRGNGPFASPPIDLGGRALTIRAGPGFRPVLRLVPGVAPDDYLLQTHAPLVLEGLEIREASKTRSQPALAGRCVIYSDANMLSLGACRLLREEPAREGLSLIMAHSRISLRNCSLYNPNGTVVSCGNDEPLNCVVENCVGIGFGPLVYVHWGHKSNKASVTLHRNTLHCSPTLMVGLSTEPDRPPPEKADPRGRIRFDLSSNVVDAQSGTLEFEQVGPSREGKPWSGLKDASAVVGSMVGWRGEGNVYPPGRRSIQWHEPGRTSYTLGPAELAGWDPSWDRADRELSGRVKSVGGDLRSRIGRGADRLVGEDFRLRPDSAGYRAGPGGKDIGADVDLVGPGAAYERWKATPDYQQWLKDTGQVKK